MNYPVFSTLLNGRIPRSHLAQTVLSGAYQDNFIATKLIGHYPYHLAIPVLGQLQFPNIFPFNAAIRVLSEQSPPVQAFSLFLDLKRQLLYPNDFTFCFLPEGMSRHADPVLVRQLHVQGVKSGFCIDPFVCNALLHLYAKGVRDLRSACRVFDEIPERERSSTVYCWTGVIAGYAQTGENERALQIFLKMIIQQLRPDSDAMVSVLSACATLRLESVERWINLFERVIRDSDHGNVGDDQVNAGDTEKSRAPFDDIGDIGKRSVVTWNAVINVYVQNGCASEALSIFQSMMDYPHVQPNHVTMVSILSACAQIGDINLGTWIHEYIKSKGKKGALSMNNSLIATALIDMYSKCGNLKDAEEVFNLMASKDVVSVNAMIMGLAINGKGDDAIALYEKLPDLGLKPNAGTFLGVLYSCSHSGKVEKGRQIFHAMREKLLSPQLEHYACYIDLLARVGCIEEAIEVVINMPMEPNNYVWGALLSGCLAHSRTELAQEISRNLVGKDPENPGGYVMLSNVMASGLKWSGVYKLGGLMREKGIKKHPGCSWISVDGVVHQFLA
ncbi:hypothetical protein V2J09_009646 [Rumex salicifolius]